VKKKTVLVADYNKRFIWFDGEINQSTANQFLKILRNFKRRCLNNVTIYIRGIGGDFSSVFMMIRAMRESGLNIGCVAHDYVMSGCFALTQAGGGWTAALSKTKFCFHSAILDLKKNEQYGFNKPDRIEIVAMSEALDAIQLSWYLSKSHRVEEIFHLLYNDVIINAPQAMRLGLIDAYFDRNEFLKDQKIVRQIVKNNKRRPGSL